MSQKTQDLKDRYYVSKPGWENGTVTYHNLLAQFMENDSFIALEIGPGLTNPSSDFMAARVGRLDGLDIDERARGNTALENVSIYEGTTFPLGDETYDVIVADYVMEHVEFPKIMLSEVERVLKPGGHFIFRTPNMFHYVSLISKFSPHSFHLAVANKARQSTGEVDPYPTFYRYNTVGTVKKIAREAGMHVVYLNLIEKEPSYLQFNRAAFMLGVAYERVVNASTAFNFLRANILCAVQKPV